MGIPNKIRRGTTLANVKLTPPYRRGENEKEIPPSEIAVRSPFKGGLRNTGGEKLARLFPAGK